MQSFVFGPKLTKFSSKPSKVTQPSNHPEVKLNAVIDSNTKDSPIISEDISFSEIIEGPIHNPLKSHIRIFEPSHKPTEQSSAPQLHKSMEENTINVTVVLPSKQKKYVLHIQASERYIGVPQNAIRRTPKCGLLKEINNKKNLLCSDDSSSFQSTNASQLAEGTLRNKPFFIFSQQNRNHCYSPDIPDVKMKVKVKENKMNVMNLSPNQEKLISSKHIYNNKLQGIETITAQNKRSNAVHMNNKPLPNPVAQNALKTIRAPLKGLHRRICSQVLENNKIKKCFKKSFE